MPISRRINEKDVYARLRPIYDEIGNILNIDSGYTLTGPGVRDAYFGGLNQHFKIMLGSGFTGLTKHFLFKWLNSTDHYSEGIYYSVTKLGKFSFDFVLDNIYWNFDNILFDKSFFRNPTLPMVDLLTIPQTAQKAKDQLICANEICQQFGWTISPGALETLARIIEREAPLEKAQPVVGFRAYNIANGYLSGAKNVIWETAKLSVDCLDFRLHIREAVSTVQGIPRNTYGDALHGCGIYIFKDPAECVHYYGIGKKMDAIAAVIGWGDTWEGERGYRVEHSRIEKLWVLKDNVQLRPYEIYGGVIVNAKLNDFYRDIYTSGLEFDTSRSTL